MLRPVAITKGTPGFSSAIDDKICILVVNGPSIAASDSATGVANNAIFSITSLKAAEAKGITAEYDSTNKVRVHRHISEFFRMAGSDKTLFVVIASADSTMKTMIEGIGKSAIIAAAGTAFYIAFAYNPATGYAPVTVDGLEDKIRESIIPAQALHQWSWDTDRPVNVFLEGRGFSATGATALDLRNITNGTSKVNGTHVTLCIGQDYDYAVTQDAIGQKFADVGTLLGTKASIAVNQDVGEVETLDISNALKSIWITPGISNHKTIVEVDEDIQDLDAKGYVFGVTYTGIAGVRWNGDHVCNESVVDDDGYMSISTIRYGATLNKASRLLRAKLLPKIKMQVPIDSNTGLLPTGMVKYFENLGDEAFQSMLSAGEVSDAATTVNPNSNLLTGSKALETSFTIVPTASLDKIKATLNLKTTI